MIRLIILKMYLTLFYEFLNKTQRKCDRQNMLISLMQFLFYINVYL